MATRNADDIRGCAAIKYIGQIGELMRPVRHMARPGRLLKNPP